MSSKAPGSGRTFGLWRFVIALAIVGYVAAAFGGVVLSGYRLNQQADVLRREIDELKADNERLQKQARYLETDEAIEKLAREQLGLLKQGETAIITVPNKKVAPSVVAASPAVKPTARPNWRHWWDFLFGS